MDNVRRSGAQKSWIGPSSVKPENLLDEAAPYVVARYGEIVLGVVVGEQRGYARASRATYPEGHQEMWRWRGPAEQDERQSASNDRANGPAQGRPQQDR